MRVRIAESQDITEIESLYSQLFAAMAELQPKFIRPAAADRAFIKKNIEESESDILIAEENGNTEGFLLIQEKRLPLMIALYRIDMLILWILAWMNAAGERVSVQCCSSRPEHGPRKEIWNI